MINLLGRPRKGSTFSPSPGGTGRGPRGPGTTLPSPLPKRQSPTRPVPPKPLFSKKYLEELEDYARKSAKLWEKAREIEGLYSDDFNSPGEYAVKIYNDMFNPLTNPPLALELAWLLARQAVPGIAPIPAYRGFALDGNYIDWLKSLGILPPSATSVLAGTNYSQYVTCSPANGYVASTAGWTTGYGPTCIPPQATGGRYATLDDLYAARSFLRQPGQWTGFGYRPHPGIYPDSYTTLVVSFQRSSAAYDPAKKPLDDERLGIATGRPGVAPQPALWAHIPVVAPMQTRPARPDPYTRKGRALTLKPYQRLALQTSTSGGIVKNRIVAHDLLPPGKRVKERKGKWPAGLSGLISVATDYADIVKAANGALPKKYRYKGQDVLGMSAHVYRNVQHMDVGKFITTLVQNEFEDRVIGALASQKGAKEAFRKYRWLAGPAAGPAI